MGERVFEKDKNILVPIPKKIVKHVGLRPGKYVEVSDDGYHIILTPIEDEFTEEEWKKIRALAKTKGKTYKTFKGAKRHLQKLKK